MIFLLFLIFYPLLVTVQRERERLTSHYFGEGGNVSAEVVIKGGGAVDAASGAAAAWGEGEGERERGRVRERERMGVCINIV